MQVNISHEFEFIFEREYMIDHFVETLKHSHFFLSFYNIPYPFAHMISVCTHNHTSYVYIIRLYL